MTFALQLYFGKGLNRAANRLLSFALGAAALVIAGELGRHIDLARTLTWRNGLPIRYEMAIGPLVYFYVLELTHPDHLLGRKDLLHFGPLLLVAGLTAFRVAEPLLQPLAWLFILYYLYRSQTLIRNYYLGLQPVLMDRPLTGLRWLRRLLEVLGSLSLLWVIYVLVHYSGNDRQAYPIQDLFYLVFTLLMILIGATALFKSMPRPASELHLTHKPPVPPELIEKGRWLKQSMKAGLYYCDPELTLASLAEGLQLHTHELSRILNTALKKSFYDFVNEYRVRDVIAKMQDPAFDHLTLLGIAFEAGFNSQTSFARIFKQFTGKAPLDYKNDLKKERSTYKLDSGRPFAPVILRRESNSNWTHDTKLNRIFMFKSYLKTTVRFLLKNKSFSLINISGLAVGTLCCLYILLYVQDQYSYDRHHRDGAGIYRVTTSMELAGDKHNSATTSPPIAPAMKSNFPEVVQFTRLVPTDMLGNARNMIRYREKSFYENGLVYVDPAFFDVFTYHFVHGKNTKDLLTQPYTVVLQQSVSDKLLGDVDPVGKVITIDNTSGKHDFKIAGVVDERLGKTSITGNIFVSMHSGGFGDFTLTDNDWGADNFACSYVKLRPGADPSALEKKLPGFLNEHGAQRLKELGMSKSLHLQPISSVHTTPGYESELSKTVSPTLLYILAGIAIMIQLIACINFMNLSTARASKRAREVGVRKAMGAGRGDLVRQFLGESFLLAMTGVLLAIPLLYLALPYFNQVTQTNIQMSFLDHTSVWLMLAGIVVITGAVAGSYPAFYLSAFEAVKVLKGNFTNRVSASGIRRSLVVFQFFLSIVLITSIIIIYSQLNYVRNKDLGFDQSQKLIFSFYTRDAQQKMTALATDFQQLSEVKQVSRSNNYLSQFVNRDRGVYRAGGNLATAVEAQNMDTDEKFVKANGIRIIAGRDFHIKDSLKTLINETLCKRLGLSPEKAPGTRLFSKLDDGTLYYADVVGVMKDFNYNSLHDEVKPFMLLYNGDPNAFSFMTVSVSSTDYKSLLAKLEGIWQKDLQGVPFEYAFLDDQVQKQYAADTSLSNIINAFTVMAILISCLGLFGLAAFSAEQRQKEIGIRKVLGASVAGVAGLLSKEFIWLVGIAFVLATPLAWTATHQWLKAFAYKVPVTWWMFAIAGGLSMLIALLTVSFQAVKAALAKPVKTLRSE